MRQSSRHYSVYEDIQEETLTLPKVQVCLKEYKIFLKGRIQNFWYWTELNICFKENISENPPPPPPCPD